MKRRRVAILGSTGSIGTQALDVIGAHQHRFEVVGLAAGKNTGLLAEQSATFAPEMTATAADGPRGLRRVAIESKPDILLAATDGFVAFDVVFEAVQRGIHIAIANKELIVAAGSLLMECARKSGARIIPVDSEHSALFQCLVGEDARRIHALIVTASGGPFRLTSKTDLQSVTLAQALAHPTWHMGVKNTIDSATLMNKGLEMIEAVQLFGVPPPRVHIVVHPQSIAHGAVVFTDGNVKAQLAAPDMRLPIGYALAYPDRLETDLALDPLLALGGHLESASLRYDFERPDPDRFPCVRLAYEAAEAGGTAPATLSAANEVAVAAFVGGEIGFSGIPAVIEKVMRAGASSELTLESVREADRQARNRAKEAVSQLQTGIEV
ncbi:MAG: 1-deoxy-D-xylulose-5-phosphate reductoisomerase [Candidatus Eremiobacteraeota bacterium]|nr:1-deoxy-D-xylulose-5-phosphate reductoisomerase [Candidatus Eremiobacteraeota bacterium]